MRITCQLLAMLIPVSTMGAALDAQERVFVLGEAAWSALEPRSRIAGIGALADGRLIVSDSKDRELHLVSRDGRRSEPFASRGEGPGEYRMPFSVLRGPGDTLLIYDAGNRRYLRVSPAGTRLADLAVPVAFLQAGGIAPGRGVDGAGAVYFQADVVGMVNGAPKRNERQSVKRWRPGAERLDTVARPRDHSAASHANAFFPFAERDAFVVARDGRVGVLSAADYRLTWYRDGVAVATGPAITHEAVRITTADREAFRRERAASPAGMARASGGGGEPSPQMLRRVEEMFPDATFPDAKPPFIEDGALLSPGEDVWVIRSGPHGERRARIDILTSGGVRRGWLALPEGRRLVALAREGVYLARIDEDGLEWLERYGWPPGLR